MSGDNALGGRIRRAYRDRGLGGLLSSGLRRLAAALFETNCAFWLRRDLYAAVPRIKPRIELEISNSFEEALAWIAALGLHWMANEREIELARAGKHISINAKHQGTMIGVQKAAFGRVYIPDFRRVVHFPEGTAFIYDVYVSPEYRGRGVATVLVEEACAALRDMGFQSVLTHIPPWNAASLKACERSGFVRVGFIRNVRVLGLGLSTANPANLALSHP